MENQESETLQIKFLESISQIVFDLNLDNIGISVELTMKFFDPNYQKSFNRVLVLLVYSSFISRRIDANIYFSYLKSIESHEEQILNTNPQIFITFRQYLLHIKTNEANYLLVNMVFENLIDADFVKTRNEKYFMHLMPHEQLSKIKYSMLSQQIVFKEEELKKNNWELHKRLIKEGNPNEITKIIRNDDVDKLQEISTSPKFNFNQKVQTSIYELFSLCKGISLIDYAAFYGAIKCFKFLLLNEAKTEMTLKYAIAGGNIEIIYLCQEKSIISSYELEEIAIEYNRNNVFINIFENPKPEPNKTRGFVSKGLTTNLKSFSFKSNFNFGTRKIGLSSFARQTPQNSEDKLHQLGLKCIRSNNFEIFEFLLNEGLEIKGDIMEEIITSGNLFLIKYILQGRKVPREAFSYSISSQNIEVIKYILSLGEVDINIYDIFDVNLIFVLFIECLN